MKNASDPFGLLTFLHWNHDWNNFHFKRDVLRSALTQLEDLGISMIRLDILWSDLHRGFHQYDFSRYDDLIADVHKKNLQVLAVLHYNKSDLRDGKEIWNTPPESFEEFAAYVGATVARYKSQIHHWEIWNEPNLSVYWNAPKDNLASYSKLLRRSSQAAKKSDPTCVILNGGLTEPIVEDVGNLYRQGVKDSFDILNIHSFLNPLDPQSHARFETLISETEKTMDENGDHQKKIWITEMGCPGLPKDKMNLTWFGGNPMDEQQQADWLETQYEWIKKFPRVEKLFWAFYRDTENEFKDATDYLGLVRLDLSPKPAFHRMKRLIQRYRG